MLNILFNFPIYINVIVDITEKLFLFIIIKMF